MGELRSRIYTEKQKDGTQKVVVLDPHSGRVVSQHTTKGDGDVRKIKELLDSKGHRTDVIERG